MPRDLYDCIAAELATHSIEHLQHDKPPSDAAAWLDEHGYDTAPVYADDDPIGFIHKDDVATDDDSDTLNDHLFPLTIDYMISGDTSFRAVLSALIGNPCISSVPQPRHRYPHPRRSQHRPSTHLSLRPHHLPRRTPPRTNPRHKTGLEKHACHAKSFPFETAE